MITRRRTGALLATIGLAFAATSSPALALPLGQWWYGNLDIAKANKTSTGAGVTVAVLDSGVQADLPDFGGRVLAGTAFYGSGDARQDIASTKASYYGHGTAVAALIAGNGRGAGFKGVAPQAKILPVTVGPKENSEADAIEQGIVWAADHGAKVINMSIAGPGACPAAMQKAVDYAVRKDVIVVAGTGNTAGVPIGFPANCIGTIGAGGMAYADDLQAWNRSTTGAQLDFVAPAERMTALLLDNTLSKPNASGTSLATALISGTFALLRSKFPDESARQIVTRALYNVANGLGGKIFAKRIDDKLGYGEILPNFALTEAPPANAQNPIYDEYERHLAAATSAPASPGGSSGGTAADFTNGNTFTQSSDGSNESSGGLSGAIVALIVVLVVAVIALVIVLLARSRRRPRY